MASRQPMKAVSHHRRWRYVKNAVTTGAITAGGISVLLAVLLILVFLLYEIYPLFKSADLEPLARYSGSNASAPLQLRIDERSRFGFRLAKDGSARFISLSDGRDLKELSLLQGSDSVRAYAADASGNGTFALATSAGELLIARAEFPSGAGAPEPAQFSITFPYGRGPLNIGGDPPGVMALRDDNEGLLVVASSGATLFGTRWLKSSHFLTGRVELTPTTLPLPVLDIAVQRLFIGEGQRWLFVLSPAAEYRLVNLESGEIVDRGRLFDHAGLATAELLLGGISLLASSDEGELGQWFVSRSAASPSGYRLSNARRFDDVVHPAAVIAPEQRRKGFAVVDHEGRIAVFHSTANRLLLSGAVQIADVVAMTQSPRADRLLLESGDGEMQLMRLDNPHPEVSWSSLWRKVWYESYPQPDYIWQSSAASNDFEPKYSLVPLAFGTLKAAFYTMIIAAPLAISAAIYTAYFMAPSLRRKTKPLVELMEAMPTVILGFLAGLWLAPFVERNLPAIFSMLLLLPVSIVLFALVWEKLPQGFRQSLPDGHHPLWLMPFIAILAVICLKVSAPLELWLFNGDMRAWLSTDLGIDFDQRNAMVVGLAMGVAVVPTIYSIAEDAIFAVPKHLSEGSLALGATPWQSLVGVVLPTASPGIFSALMIGLGRAVGETMIVLMATGNTPIMHVNIFEGMRTLSANIAIEVGETAVGSSHYRVLFLTALVLFLFTFIVNGVAEIVRLRLRKRYGSVD